jgi:hypothetical protein
VFKRKEYTHVARRRIQRPDKADDEERPEAVQEGESEAVSAINTQAAITLVDNFDAAAYRYYM